MLHLKIIGLSLGYSGVSKPVFDQLIAFSKKAIVPWIPSRGSVGASGDLAPLSHLSLPLIGRGFVWGASGREPAARALKRHGLKPAVLSAKDGLALVNGTQFMLAYGLHAVRDALRLCRVADVASAMTLEALQGSVKPFDQRIHAVRPHPGQGVVAANMRRLLKGSKMPRAARVQDPYSLRCVPQVHGAVRDMLSYAARVLETEVGSATDNPLVFPDGDILSGGNFHGEPLALALDAAAIALSELASISERRTYLLLNGIDGLPPFLVHNGGLNSGLMITQYTAAALVSENKVNSHPASVDSIPTSRGQEDHVSMGSISALKLFEIVERVRVVVAIEVLCAAQALDLRRPLVSAPGTEAVRRALRRRVPFLDRDREVATDIEACVSYIKDQTLVRTAERAIGGAIK